MPKNLEKAPTHIKGLDEILEGGLPRGRTTVINGGPGSGKTLLALAFLYRALWPGNRASLSALKSRSNICGRTPPPWAGTCPRWSGKNDWFCWAGTSSRTLW